MKKLRFLTLGICAFLMCLSGAAFAENSLSGDVDGLLEEASLDQTDVLGNDVQAIARDAGGARGGGGSRGDFGGRGSASSSGRGGHPATSRPTGRDDDDDDRGHGGHRGNAGGGHHGGPGAYARDNGHHGYHPHHHGPAHPPPPPHPPRYRHRHYHDTVVVVEDTHYVTTSSEVVSSATYSFEPDPFSIGVRMPVWGEGNTYVNGDVFDNYATVGIGLVLRYRPIPYFGIELSSQALFSGSPSENQWYESIRVPTTVGLLGFTNPYSRFTGYGVLAGGFVFNNLDYSKSVDYLGSSLKSESYYQGQMQVGVGGLSQMTHFQIGFDVRYTLTQARPELTHGNPFLSSGYGTRSDKVEHGILFNLDIAFSF